MSLRDEMATDYAEIIAEDGTTMTYTGTVAAPTEQAITGRKGAAVPSLEETANAGYDPSANCLFIVLKSDLDAAGITPVERAKFTNGSFTWTIMGIDDRKDQLAYVYSLKKIP